MTSVHRLRSINAKKTTRRHIIVKFWRAEQRKNKNSKGRRKTTYNSTKNIKHLGINLMIYVKNYILKTIKFYQGTSLTAQWLGRHALTVMKIDPSPGN